MNKNVYFNLQLKSEKKSIVIRFMVKKKFFLLYNYQNLFKFISIQIFFINST